MGKLGLMALLESKVRLVSKVSQVLMAKLGLTERPEYKAPLVSKAPLGFRVRQESRARLV
jgi:hypothetical protein